MSQFPLIRKIKKDKSYEIIIDKSAVDKIFQFCR